LNELALFAGAGGGILGGKLLGWKTVCAVEIDAYCASILVARQNDEILEPFPIWNDVRTFDGGRWRGIVDVVSGGFPCQDISIAGLGRGIDGERSGLWREMSRIIGEIRPRFAFVENSPALVTRGLGRILGDLEEMGYNARWGIFSACSIGAPHSRERLFLLVYTNSKRLPRPKQSCQKKAEWPLDFRQTIRDLWSKTYRCDWWNNEPAVGRVANRMAHWVDRIKVIGNGQVPSVAANAFRILLNSDESQ